MEKYIEKSLDGIFNHVDKGHRREGCDRKHIEEYFEYLIKVSLVFEIYTGKILDFVNKIKNLDLSKFDSTFFILFQYKIYEDELKQLILSNTRIEAKIYLEYDPNPICETINLYLNPDVFANYPYVENIQIKKVISNNTISDKKLISKFELLYNDQIIFEKINTNQTFTFDFFENKIINKYNIESFHLGGIFFDNDELVCLMQFWYLDELYLLFG